MVEKRFNKLGMPDIERFENYLPTAFSSELTLLQKVNKIIQDLIASNKLTNEMVDYLNNFIETFDEKLYQTVEDVLSKWLEDGVLSDLIREVINEEVVEARTDYLGKKYVNLKERLDSEKADVYKINNLYKPIFNNNQKIQGLTHIMAGIDSLSNGAGGSCWVDNFRHRLYNQFGCGGIGYVGLHNTQVVEFGTWNTNLPSIVDTEYQQYSLDAKGVYRTNQTGGDHVWLYLDKNYTNVKIIYLKMPTGGTFECSWINEPSTKQSVNTKGDVFDLGVIELTGNNSLRKGWISLDNFTDDVVIFGLYCYNKQGVIVSKIGLGGDKFEKHANLNDTFREKWIDIITPDYYILNGGTNDNQTLTPQAYETLLNKYVAPFKTKNVNMIIVSPNRLHVMGNMYEFEKIMQKVAIANKFSFFQHYKLLGDSYEIANSLGYMLDGTHPSELGNIKISNFWLEYFGVPKIGGVTLNNSTWESSTNPSTYVYKTNLTSKQVSIANGATQQIYNLGVVGGYSGGLVNLHIIGRRTGSTHIVDKNIYIPFGNGTTNNTITTVGIIGIKQNFEYSVTPNPTVDFTLNATVESNKLNITLSPNTGSVGMDFYIEGSVYLPYCAVKGQSVYEN